MALLEKTTDEIKDYTFDWSSELASGETISTSVFTIENIALVTDPDILPTESSKSNTDTTTTIKLAGGTLNNIYKITNTITTSAAQTLEDCKQIKIEEVSCD